MKLRDKISYGNRPLWIVGIRQPKSHETGRFFDLARSPDTAIAGYKDVPENRLREWVEPEINEVLEEVREFNRLRGLHIVDREAA